MNSNFTYSLLTLCPSMKRFFLFIIIAYCLTSCQDDKKPFSVNDLRFLTNIDSKDSTIRLPLDLDDAILNGIEIPSKKQTKNGYFNFSFKIKNTSKNIQQFFYKIYYQNESYKFNETSKLANENFYGSWENYSYTFKPTKFLSSGEEIEIKDSFKIVGNPRNEKIFYGSNPFKHPINDTTIRSTINYMKTMPDWINLIKEKAEKNKVSVEEQFYIDALWSLNDQKQRDSTDNNHWKRNPRVGLYKFLLVLTTHEGFDNIPYELKDISSKNKDGVFSNPFSYFNSSEFSDSKNTLVVNADKKIVVSAKLDLSKGVYINPLSVNKKDFVKDYFNQNCSDSIDKYTEAQMELYFHNINRDYVLRNIPETRDVTGENFTRKEYQELMKKYQNSNKLINTYVNSTDCPCKNIIVNPVENSITFKNPGNKEGEFKKEHVGLVSRIGMTYGKFRAKIKFAEILNKDNMWNGITNAFWMIGQDINSNWNMRRPCNAEIGYIAKGEADDEKSLWRSKKQISYSEIDFEILKESEFWPISSYKKSNTTYKTDNCASNRDIMVTCTNWDMACHEPKKFNVGATEYTTDDINFIHHRWNQWSKALTTKTPANHDDLFKAPYYYFEIEWTPEKIIWRIGPEKNNMRVVCIMDENVSAIPNNQMLMVITQEWHNQEWWPTAPFKQNFIPFPKNDIVGKVLELEIE